MKVFRFYPCTEIWKISIASRESNALITLFGTSCDMHSIHTGVEYCLFDAWSSRTTVQVKELLHTFLYIAGIGAMPLPFIMKYFLQVLSSIVYSPIAAALLILITVYPLFWILEASKFWFIVLVLSWSIVQLLAHSILAFIFTPYAWIAEDNDIASTTSILIIIGLSIFYIISIWIAYTGQGFGMVVLALIGSFAIIRNVFWAILCIIAGKNGSLM